MLRAILLKLMSSLTVKSCRYVWKKSSNYLNQICRLFLSFVSTEEACWEYNTELRCINLNLVSFCFIFSSSDFLSKIYTCTQIPLNFRQHDNIYNTRKSLFSVIVSTKLYCTGLTLCRFLLGFLKVFYLQMAQNTHEWM